MSLVERLVERICGDRVSGASQLTVKAAESFLELIEEDGALEDVRSLGALLRKARPSMPSIANISTLVMKEIEDRVRGGRRLKEAVREAVDEVLNEYRDRMKRVIEVAASTISRFRRILTHSYSSTVASILEKVKGLEVYVTESRPGMEGVRLAERLLDAGLRVTLIIDSAASHIIREIDAVIVGCDALFRDGSFANKIGTRMIALAAESEEKPFYVATDLMKAAVHGFGYEHGPPEEVYRSSRPIRVLNPYFEVTSPHLVHRYLTDEGELDEKRLRGKLNEIWSRLSLHSMRDEGS